MSVFKCKMCGGTLEIHEHEGVAECEYCGTLQTLPKSKDETIQNLFNRANNLRLKCEFDKAEQIYEKILELDNTEAEAHWGIILCKYGIEYVEDPKTFKRIPTCHRTSFESITASAEYLAAMEYADYAQKGIYEKEAKEIDDIQRSILNIVKNERPFDVFLCYKETDENGKRTIDSSIANEIYYQLTQEGFKVFYAAITLEDKLGQEYEPYIFAALNSAKVMLVIGTKLEYFEAVWVKNEWSRFMKLMKTDRSKLLIPCYKDMDAYDLPEEFAHLQAQDMGKIGFINDVTRGIKKVLIPAKEESAPTVGVPASAPQVNTASLLKRAFMFLEDGDFASADEYCEKVLDNDPECAEAYLGKLMVELKVRKRGNLAELEEAFEKNSNYQKILKFGDQNIKLELVNCISEINARNDEEKAEKKKEKEANARKNKKNLQIMLWVVVAIVAFTAIFSLVIKPMNEYNYAVGLMESGNYEEAIIAFETMEGYRDSEEQVAECKYLMAFELMNDEKYEEAIDIFKEIENYKDCKKMAEDCATMMKDELYQKAIILMTNGKYKEAIKAFEDIKDYKDSKKFIAECEEKINEEKYLEAATLFENGEYEAAISAFEEIIDYKDSAEQIETVKKEQKYQEAVSLMDSGKYKKAIDIFEEIKDYKDSAKKIKTCNNKLNESSSKPSSSSNTNHNNSNIDLDGSDRDEGYGSFSVLTLSFNDEIGRYQVVCDNCGRTVEDVMIDHYIAGYGIHFDVDCTCGNRGEVFI